MTSNGQSFDATLLRIWCVTGSHAVVEGKELGTPASLVRCRRSADDVAPPVLGWSA